MPVGIRASLFCSDTLNHILYRVVSLKMTKSVLLNERETLLNYFLYSICYTSKKSLYRDSLTEIFCFWVIYALVDGFS